MERIGRLLFCLTVFALLGANVNAAVKVNYRVSGSFVYFDHEGRMQPAAGVTARIMDKDIAPGDSDDLLATTVTDPEGKFSVEFPADEYQDIYVLFIAENDVWKVTTSSGSVYTWHTPVKWDVTSRDTNVDFGIQGIGRGSDSLGNGQNVGAMWIYQAVRQSAEFLAKNAVSLTGDAGQYTVVWTDVNDTTYSSGMTTYISRNHAYQYDVIIHETGHILMNAYSKIPKGSGGRHRIDGSYSRELAWAEGWATFYAACVILTGEEANASLPYFAGGVNIENVPANFAAGDTNEMRVAAALWDLYDRNADGPDNMSVKFADIFQILQRSNGRAINTFEEAVTLYVQYNCRDRESVKAVYKVLDCNTIHYSAKGALSLVVNE
jgi:hypothetical protein